MQVGDTVLKRRIYRGNVRWTFPHRYVGEWDGRIGIYCGAGNQGKAMRRGPEGYLRRWMTDAPPSDTEWEQTGWYVNLRDDSRVGWTPAPAGTVWASGLTA